MFKLIGYVATFCLLSATALAAPHYAINPDKSSLKFVATQNDAPIEAQFKKFTGDIRFDPAKPAESSIEATVDMSSVSASYEEVPKTLAGKDWFDSASFPTATFKTLTVEKTGGENNFVADGELTIRGVKQPVKINFIVEKYTPEQAIATGKITLLRTQFGVGQGEWQKTDGVKDPVTVTFRVLADAVK